MEWVFDGIGSELISVVLGIMLGGGVGYKVGINKKKISQKQKAGNEAIQIQIGEGSIGKE